jgi:hypothetical protein
VVDAFGEHSGEEQRVVANMFAHLAFAVERGRWSIDRIRFHQHLANIRECTPGGIANPEELLHFAELGDQVSDVVDDERIAQANFFRVMPTHKLHEELPQWMRLWNHPGLPPNPPATRESPPQLPE